MSKNVNILLASIDVLEDEKHIPKFVDALSEIDKGTFTSFIEFHSVIPVFAEALKICQVKNNTYDGFAAFQQAQAFINLRVAQELHELLGDFAKENIPVLPYKGVLFTNEIFNNQTLRSSGDVDLLFKKENMLHVFETLLNKGYVFDKAFTKKISDSQEIVKAVLESNVIEITMMKNGIFFDIHWGLHYDFYDYKVPYESYFENIRKTLFYGKETILPSVETMFWMIILHNGGKECWFRIKHIVDLKYFMAKYANELDWNQILQQAKAYKLWNVMLAGLFILKDKFNVLLPDIIEVELSEFDCSKCSAIYAYWPFATYWNTLFPRIKYEKVFISLQDKPFSVTSYFYRFLKSYSIPNPIFNDRFVVFPKQFALLNALSKVISYTIKKFRS